GPRSRGRSRQPFLVRPAVPKYHVDWHNPGTPESTMRILPALLVLALASPLPADEPKAHRGLPYAEPKNERQTLDVYAPTEGKNLPVVVWIHGGGWRRGAKTEPPHKPKGVPEKGLLLGSLNSRLLPALPGSQDERRGPRR